MEEERKKERGRRRWEGDRKETGGRRREEGDGNETGGRRREEGEWKNRGRRRGEEGGGKKRLTRSLQPCQISPVESLPQQISPSKCLLLFSAVLSGVIWRISPIK
ncbi:hypothetical protein NE237_024358 [Protea cynaroides]|uniref:Uncharacterized protein n=1 Tax=Protea cynaroides TaxID=273540 RepID=A0A9Q0HIF1_9MAGN|nr:hypothetical protein NE237_024358 [Protea cynaroides]